VALIGQAGPQSAVCQDRRFGTVKRWVHLESIPSDQLCNSPGAFIIALEHL
jgi:hypothetical protein